MLSINPGCTHDMAMIDCLVRMVARLTFPMESERQLFTIPAPRAPPRKDNGNHRGVSLIERGVSTQMNDTHSGLKLYPCK